MLGAEIRAPNGLGQLRKDVVYRFAGNSRQRNRVVLTFFSCTKAKHGKGIRYNAHALTMEREKFEAGLSQGAIVASEGPTLPPWLARIEGMDPYRIDAKRLHAKKPFSAYAENRLLHIQPALENLESILSADDIEAEIGVYARACTPAQNETRYRTWLLTYLSFGRYLWALLPPFANIGRWDRDACATQKQGAPSIGFGKNYGYAMTPEMADACISGYIKHRKPGYTSSRIYAEVVTKEFGCKVKKGSAGTKEFYHPNDIPFPSYRQFYRQVMKKIGIEVVQKNRYGSSRHRRSLAPSKGRFSEELAYLHERVEYDAYYTKEHPKGYLDGNALSALCVVRAIDGLSAERLGIGFSLGSETMSAYRMAHFCMAVPKGYFCALFGIVLGPDEWISMGLSPNDVADRGPGSSENLILPDDGKPPIRDMTPSYSPQSKATVESSHPRDVHFEGQQHYVASNLTVIELIRRELYGLIRENHTSDVSARMPVSKEFIDVLPTPHELYKFYDTNFRNVGTSMSIETAVRSFLTSVQLRIEKDGVYLDTVRYSSNELRESGLLDRFARGHHGTVYADGYMLDLCIRHVWIEADHKLLRLDAQLPTREDKETAYISILELEEWKQKQSENESRLRVHRLATIAETLDRFERDTGKGWGSGTRKPGRVIKSAGARQETREVNQRTSKRRSS